MKEAVLTDRNSDWRVRVADYLALEHNVTIASAAVFLLGFGEELWKKFLPKYLERLAQLHRSLVCSAQQKTSSMLVTSIQADLSLIVLADVELS